MTLDDIPTLDLSSIIVEVGVIDAPFGGVQIFGATDPPIQIVLHEGLQGPQGDPGPQGPTGADGSISSVNSSTYRFLTATTNSDPGSGKLKFDSTIPNFVANLYISGMNFAGTDVSAFLSLIMSNDTIIIQDQDNASNVIRLKATGVPVDNSGWFTIPVEHISHAGVIPNNNSGVVAIVQME